MTDTALLDVDGTLVDSNYQHVLAWQRAFTDHDLAVPAWRIHRHLGMGGDQLVPALVGDGVEHEHGDDLRASWRNEFDPLLAEVRPLEGATELIRALRDLGLTVVLASSGPAEHVERYVDLVRARDLAAARTTADDVGTTKPAPDLLEVAMRKAGGSSVVTIGDSTWDCEASRRLGAACIADTDGWVRPRRAARRRRRDVHDSFPDLTAALTRRAHPGLTRPERQPVAPGWFRSFRCGNTADCRHEQTNQKESRHDRRTVRRHAADRAPARPGPAQGQTYGDGQSSSTTDAAKEQAGQVGQTAKESGKQVAGTAAEQGKHVLDEGRYQARNLTRETRTRSPSRAGRRRTRPRPVCAVSPTSCAGWPTARGTSGIASDLVQQASEKAGELGEWLENREPGDLVAELRGLARRKPGTFLLGALPQLACSPVG